MQIPRLVERYKANALANDDEYRPVLFNEPPAIEHDDTEHDDEAHKSLLLEARRQLRRARAADDYSEVRESVEEHLAWERTWLPAASEEFLTVLKAIADAQLAVFEEELRRIEGDVVETTLRHASSRNRSYARRFATSNAMSRSTKRLCLQAAHALGWTRS